MFSRLLSILSLSLITLPVHAALDWQTDYALVQKTSLDEQKNLLLFFNGSDWSGPAMKMKHEVLQAPSFLEKIESKFLCMEVDFPEHTPLSDLLKEQNLSLKERFGIDQTPCLLILDSEERLIAKISYVPESGEQLAQDLLKIVDQDRLLQKNLQDLVCCGDLQNLYQIAQELNRPSALDQILEYGLKVGESFFFLEKYRLLVEEGKMLREETVALRQKILGLDPKNAAGMHFTLALIDFQELSQRASPELAIKPLIDYLESFGQQDRENVWRIEMMIAQHYLDQDAWQEALKHAKKAYDAAPQTMQDEIACSIDYIRSRTDAVAQR